MLLFIVLCVFTAFSNVPISAEVLLTADKGKGLEVSGTFSRKNGQVYMDITLTNKAMTSMEGFTVQFDKNSFGLAPAQPLSVPQPLTRDQTAKTSLPIDTTGPVMKMDPINRIRIAMTNNIDVFDFSAIVPLRVLFTEDGEMDRKIFLDSWKEIPYQDAVQYTISDVQDSAGAASQKLRMSNVFTVARKNVGDLEMLYQSLRLTNGMDVLAELKIQQGNSDIVLTLKSPASDVYPAIRDAYNSILRN